MDFNRIFTRAWHIIWNNKILWLFGFLASCTSGYGRGGSSFRFPGGGASGSSDFSGDFSDLPNGQVPQFLRSWEYELNRFFSSGNETTIILIVIGLVLLGLLFAVLSFVVGNYGRVALIKGVQTSELTGEKLTFGELHRMGMAQLGQALLLNLIIGLVLFVVFGVIIGFGVLLSVLTLGIGLICLIPLICLLVPVAWAIGIVMMQANIALVTEDLKFMDALKRGWQVLRAKPGVLIGMYFVVLFGAGIIGLVFAMPYILAAIPGIIGFIADPGLSGGLGAGIIITIVAICLYTPVMLLLSSVLLSYVYALLTLTYMEITADLPAPGDAPDALPATTK